MRKMIIILSHYLSLTKPRVLLLVVLTGISAIIIEGSLLANPLKLFLSILMLTMAGGSANAFNQYFERDIDALMLRTANRRVLPSGKIHPRSAIIFAIILFLLSTFGYWQLFNTLSAILSILTILFYSFFYTLFLKPRTVHNIVIGGLAGAMGPVISWASTGARISEVPLFMSAMIFFWTPPHFWSLAIYYKEDYINAAYPMLPIIVGEKYTQKVMVVYVFITVILSLLFGLTGRGVLYFIVALAIGYIFLKEVLSIKKGNGLKSAQNLFRYSILYMFILFTAIIADKAINI